MPTAEPDANAPATGAPLGRWQGTGDAWSLALAGDWRGGGSLPPPPANLRQGRLTVDASAVASGGPI